MPEWASKAARALEAQAEVPPTRAQQLVVLLEAQLPQQVWALLEAQPLQQVAQAQGPQ